VAFLLTKAPIAPDFELVSHCGAAIRLHNTHNGLTLLIFIRGHWCPYCRRYLKKLQANAARFVERNVRLLVISPEPAATSRALAAEIGASFPILFDPDGAVIDRFGIRNGPIASKIVLPYPAVFLIDAHGAIVFRRIDRNFKRRTTMHTLFTAINSASL